MEGVCFKDYPGIFCWTEATTESFI